MAKANSQTSTFVAGGSQVEEKVSKASNAFGSWLNVLSMFKVQLTAWTTALIGGISIAIAFLPEIIGFATSLFKGKDAVAAMTQNLKNLNDVMKAANQDAATETTRLRLLYNSATDLNKSMKDRLDSVHQLQLEYPKPHKLAQLYSEGLSSWYLYLLNYS